MARMRGARPSPRHRLAGAMPHRITGPTPPEFVVVPKQLSMWHNDVDGDCVTAEEAFAKAAASVMAGQPETFITDATVLAWATKHGVLNGADLDQVLTAMRTDGFQQDGVAYDDGPATSVDWTQLSVLCNAIAQGPVKLGVAAGQLERVVGSVNGWVGTNFAHDGNLDHCISCCGYGPLSYLVSQLGGQLPSGVNGGSPGVAVFTWRTVGVLDWPSFLAITGEAWLRSPTTIIQDGPTPTPTPPAPQPSPHAMSFDQVMSWMYGYVAKHGNKADQRVVHNVTVLGDEYQAGKVSSERKWRKL